MEQEQDDTCGAGQATPLTVLVYAGLWKRFIACFVDAIFVIIFSSIAIGLTELTVLKGASEYLPYIPMILTGWLYYALMESLPIQATPGKMLLGIIVTDLNGNRIPFYKATGRYFSKFVSLLFLGIGFIMIGFTERKQALHDIMTGCLVVMVERPDSKPGRRQRGCGLGCMAAILIGIMSIMVPAYMKMCRKVRREEATRHLYAIRDCQEAYLSANGVYLKCKPSPPDGGTDNKPDKWIDAGGFTRIGFVPNGKVRYQYAVEVSKDGQSFTATALGDLDEDGEEVTWTLNAVAGSYAVRTGDSNDGY